MDENQTKKRNLHDKLAVISIEIKVRETRLRWFRTYKGDPQIRK